MYILSSTVLKTDKILFKHTKMCVDTAKEKFGNIFEINKIWMKNITNGLQNRELIKKE